MNLLDSIKALNQRAARERWHHVCDPSLTFSDPSYEKLLDLWRGKAGGRPMPRRSEMTLRDLKDVLRNLIVLERVETRPSRYRARLIGTSLTAMAGDRTGNMIEEVLPAEQAARWVICADLILDGGQPMRFLGRVHLSGKEYLNAENLFVPLANENDDPTFVMGLCRYTPRHTESEESWESQIASIPGALL
ncbi:MAG TPA: PAS domain-containing protein [Rhizomicrobium sp.]|nr:PAS domain-containing protein [Rhizomicrobium sp.]